MDLFSFFNSMPSSRVTHTGQADDFHLPGYGFVVILWLQSHPRADGSVLG